MRKTKKDFLENYCSCPKLAEKVFNQIGCGWHALIERAPDFRDASAGVSGFIYYSDTISFAKKNLVEILKAVQRFELEIGEPLKKSMDFDDDDERFLNWYAWFALETVIDEVIRFTEDNE